MSVDEEDPVLTMIRTLEAHAEELRAVVQMVELASDWNTGLTRMMLVQEFRYWRREIWAHPKAAKLSDSERDRKAADVAFEYFVRHFPDGVKEQLTEHRDALIETLKESIGFAIEFN